MLLKRYKDADDADGDVPEGVLVEEADKQEEKKESPIIVRTRLIAPRDFQISLEDVQKHGATRSCAGCSSFFKGRGK